VIAAWLAAAALLLPESVVGTVRVHRGVSGPEVALMGEDGKVLKLSGELAREVAELQSFKVEAIGVRQDDDLTLAGYVIIDVGGGQKPMVGTLVEIDDGRFALRDGTGDPIPLSISPKSKLRLAKKGGAKVWVVGEKLLSGELKVTRYGIVKEPVSAPPEPAPSSKVAP
jgi:hypothetical protein